MSFSREGRHFLSTSLPEDRFYASKCEGNGKPPTRRLDGLAWVWPTEARCFGGSRKRFAKPIQSLQQVQ
jgi:hypothetical protein